MWEGRTNTVQLSNLTKLPRTHVGPHRPCMPGQSSDGAHVCCFGSAVLSAVLTQGKSCPYLPLFSQSGTHTELIPLGKRMGPAHAGLLQSGRCGSSLIQGHQIPCPASFFSAFIQVGQIWESPKMNECCYNSQVTVNTHSTNKSLRKVFIGLNIETKFYFLKMILHTSCKCTFR